MASGFIQKPINTAITSSAWTAITLGATQFAKDIAIQARGANNFLFSDTSSGAKYFTVKSGTVLSFENINVRKETTIGYAKSAAANSTIEVFITR